MKADNLDDVLRFFNTRERLVGSSLERWFVERQRSPRQELKKWLTIQERPQKILFIGHRGSGKSTVIKLASEALSNVKGIKYHVFTYDAWIHQSDPPRRAFLEQLISFLSERELGKEEYWARELEELQRLKDETTSTTTPVLTAYTGRLPE